MDYHDYPLHLPLTLAGWQGTIAIRLDGDEITEVELCREQLPYRLEDSPVAREIERQVQDYLNDPSGAFHLALRPKGTPFQQRLWQQLQAIPSGRVQSYGELAAILGSSAQAVGNACRANPIPLFIPCHRVIAANGLGGYGGQREGAQWQLKPTLLRHEGAI